MKRIIMIIGLAGLRVFAGAQNNINQYEYWFDSDYAGRVVTDVTPVPLFTLNTEVGTANLANGLHVFHIRFRDDSLNYSAVSSRFFQKVRPGQAGANAITGFEYWFDGDYAGRVYQTVTLQALYELNTAINADTLANGLHTFHTRFVDAEGNWSSVTSRFFQKVSPGLPGGNAITGFEYWFDGNYGGKVYQTVTPQALYELNTAISADTFANGLHTFHTRFVDTEGNWSAVTSRFFQKVNPGLAGANAITGFEYWFDSDYGSKVYQTVTPQALYELNTAISADTLANGLHTFHARFVDAEGNWSAVTSRFFQKVSPGLAGANAITGFEYWFDGDYAGRVYQTATSQSLYQLDTAISAAQLAVGLHTFHIRFQDLSGNWSSTTSQFFQKIGQGAGLPNAISAYRYWFDNDVSAVVNKTLNPPSNPLYLITELNLSQVDTGEHQVHFQFRDLRGQWSVVVTDTVIKLGEPRLDYVTPDEGGNTGDVTARIAGVFFSPLKVRLEKQGELPIEVPDSLVSIIRGQEIMATFDLEGRDTGTWDLVVEIVSDTTMVLENGFLVEEGTFAEPWTELIGFSVIRPNTWQNYTLKVGNSSNVNLYGVPVWIGIPTGIETDFKFEALIFGDTLGEYDPLSNFIILDSLDSERVDSIRLYSFVVGLIPSNSEIAVTFKIKSPVTGLDTIWTWATAPLYGSPMKPGFAACLYEVSFLLGSNIPGYGCYFDLLKTTLDPIIAGALGNIEDEEDGIVVIADYHWSMFNAVRHCVNLPFSQVFKGILNFSNFEITGYQVYESCSPVIDPNLNNS